MNNELNEIKELLNKVLLNQSVIFKKIVDMENKSKGTTAFQSDKTYHAELVKQRGKMSDSISSDGNTEIY